MFSLPNPSLSFGIVQAGEVAPAFDGAIPSGSASSAPSSTDSAPSAPSSADSPGGGNGGGPDEDTPEDRDAMDVSEGSESPVAAGVARVDGKVCVFHFSSCLYVAMLLILPLPFTSHIQHVSSFPQNRPTPFPLFTVPM